MSRRRVGRAALAIVPPSPPGRDVVGQLQQGWKVMGILVAVVAALGFQMLSPSRRMERLEATNARQDSLFAEQSIAQQRTLDTIRRQLGQLIAGQCAKERDRMARLLYGCPPV